jgi:elongation factor G
MTRCVAVIGAPGTGKSSVVDRFCRLEGKAPDHAGPNELRIARFTYLGETWTAIDCPGSIEFVQDSMDALLVADAAVIVVPPDPEAAALSAPYLRAVEAAGTPSFVFVNKIDEAKGRMSEIVSALQGYANHVVVLRQVPIREGDRIVGAVDLVSERAWRYREGAPSALIQIPAELREREHEARSELLEHLSDFDDWLLSEIIEDHEPAVGPLYAICARVLGENRVMPALFGAASHANGIVRLMKALRHEAPQPAVLRARLAAATGAKAPVIAAAFHGQHRKHLGRTVFLRAFEGGLRTASPLGGGSLGSLIDVAAGHSGTLAELGAGAVAGAVKSDHLPSGHVFTSDAALPGPAWLAGFPGQISRLLQPVNERDDVKLSAALAKIGPDNRALQISQDPESGSMRVGAPGPIAMRWLRDTLADTFGLPTDEHPVPPVYREAITRSADVHYRHKKQTGGAGQFADVRLTVAPNERGGGFVFEEVVKGGAVPRNYIPAVEAGAREAMAKGPLGFPVIDVRVTLTDGQSHAVDSSDMAFKIAGRGAVAQGLSEAGPVLLQPIHLVRFHIPSVFTGAIVPIVAALKGQVLGFDRDPEAKGWDVFRALLPGPALDELAGQLRSATQGVGRFVAEFDHYQEMYGREAEKIAEARRAG